eukprot:gene20511-22529_t
MENSQSFMKDLNYQEIYEKAYNCPICFCCKLEMVYGLCQHKVCADCLYGTGVRHASLSRCPVCLQNEAFPKEKPGIPEDNISNMYQLGVRECKFQSCKQQMWHWELEEHMKLHEVVTEKKSKSKEGKNVSLLKSKTILGTQKSKHPNKAKTIVGKKSKDLGELYQSKLRSFTRPNTVYYAN